jgi:(p)ppGpp synthase/HD superfamily hydrolase
MAGALPAKGDKMSISGDTVSHWPKAMDFAAAAHHGQWMDERETWFVSHPLRVALLVATEFDCHDDVIISAAVLHDVLEKTPATREELLRNFGRTVTDLVVHLTKGPEESADSYWSRLNASPWQARLVKMADALDHLDCPPKALLKRIHNANLALELAFTGEPPVQRAKECLRHAVDQAALRQPPEGAAPAGDTAKNATC